jgi:ubiquinone/menaquinone biosynthesis C-methylase UbiE
MQKVFDEQTIRATYRSAAAHYDLWGNLFETKAKRICVEHLRLEDGMRCLDVGVGTAHAFQMILDRSPSGQHVGIDLSSEMLARARAKIGDNYSLLEGNALDLPFEDASFDALISTYVIELLPPQSYPTLLKGFHRVLRPSGRIVLAGMVEGSRWHELPARFLCRRHPAWNGGFRALRTQELLAQLGFQDIEEQHVSQGSFPTTIVSARRS